MPERVKVVIGRRLPQCQHGVKRSRSRCTHHSKYQIDGKNYCGKHAPIVALGILFAERK